MEDLYPAYNYNTLSGLILQQIGHIPKTGEAMEWNDFTLEIVDMDGARIDKVLVTLTPVSYTHLPNQNPCCYSLLLSHILSAVHIHSPNKPSILQKP